MVIATNIKPAENLTDEIFYRRKFPDLRYASSVCIKLGQWSGLLSYLFYAVSSFHMERRGQFVEMEWHGAFEVNKLQLDKLDNAIFGE